MNQPDSDSRSQQHEQEQPRESATDVWLGPDAAQRQVLAARLVQQEAEDFMTQRRYQKAIKVYVRILVVNPAHLPALQGRVQAYRQVGVEQAAALDEGALQGLWPLKQVQEQFSISHPFLGIEEVTR